VQAESLSQSMQSQGSSIVHVLFTVQVTHVGTPKQSGQLQLSVGALHAPSGMRISHAATLSRHSSISQQS
jgi:hypothetical protein